MGSRRQSRRARRRVRRGVAVDAQRLFALSGLLGRSPARSANTTANSWSIRWCLRGSSLATPAGHSRKRIAIFFIPRRAGSSAACGWPNSSTEPCQMNHPEQRFARRAHPRRRTRSPPTSLPASPPSRNTCRRNIFTTAGSGLFDRITQPAGILSDPQRNRHLAQACAGNRLAVSARLRAGRIRRRLEPQSAHSAAAPRRASKPMCRSIFLAIFCSRTRRGCAAISRIWRSSGGGGFHGHGRVAWRDRRLPRAGFFPGSTIGNFEPHEAARSCATPAACWAPARCSSSASIWSRRRTFSIAPTTMPRASPRNSISICWRASIASLAPISISRLSSTTPSTIAERSRIEMHLASTKRQKVRVGDTTIEFRAGETIHTENSYKYSIDSFRALARGSGWSPLESVDRRPVQRSRVADDARWRCPLKRSAGDPAAAAEDPCGGAVRPS